MYVLDCWYSDTNVLHSPKFCEPSTSIYSKLNIIYTNCRLKSARPTLLSSLSELRDFLKVEKYVSYVNLKQDNFLNVWLEWEHALYM